MVISVAAWLFKQFLTHPPFLRWQACSESERIRRYATKWTSEKLERTHVPKTKRFLYLLEISVCRVTVFNVSFRNTYNVIVHHCTDQIKTNLSSRKPDPKHSMQPLQGREAFFRKVSVSAMAKKGSGKPPSNVAKFLFGTAWSTPNSFSNRLLQAAILSLRRQPSSPKRCRLVKKAIYTWYGGR